MAALLAAVGLGRAARTKASAKVRQPLPAVLVWARDPAVVDAIERLQDQLLDELNVKRLERIEQPELYASYNVRPNLPVLGPKYGRQVGAIRQALAVADPSEVARTVRAGGGVALLVDGGTIELSPDEVLVDVKEREGFNVAESRDLLVALDATLTPELIAEGLARDFVRGVQDARKDAGLRIEDTIRLVYVDAGDSTAAIEAHADYIKGETLATELRTGDPSAEAHQTEVRLGRERVRIGLTRVGSLLDTR
jgi:isoleucyl-tRNA synthetase